MTETIIKSERRSSDRGKGFVSKFAGKVILLVALAFLPLLSYFAYWGIHYRQAASAPQVIDLRRDTSSGCKCVTLCASLANNELGFPGHAYVIWSPTNHIDAENDFSLGYMPAKYWDQLHSLYRNVPGAIYANVRGNSRNLDRLTLLVSDSDFEDSLEYAKKFPSSSFRTGERDCVAFVNYLAQRMGLKTYDKGFIYPQDYIRMLKKMNSARAEVSL